jgi:maltose/moltooligosaccharide transporter
MKRNYFKTSMIGLAIFGAYALWALYNVFVPILLNKKFGLSASFVGFFMSLDNLAAFIIQPAVGAFSDKTRTRIGRRMPFILIGAPISALMFGLIPLASVLPLFLACTGAFMLSMAVWRTPAMALMPDITPSQNRSQGSAIVNMMGGIGSTVASITGAALFEKDPAFPFWGGAAITVLVVVLLFLVVKEPKTYSDSSSEPQQGIRESLRFILQSKDRSVLRIMLVVFFVYLCFTGVESFLSLYAVNRLGYDPAAASRLMGQFGIIFVLSCIPSGYIAGRLGRKPIVLAGITIWGLAFLAMFLLPIETLTIAIAPLGNLGMLTVFSLLLMAGGLAFALAPVNLLAMVMDVTTTSQVGTYLGVYYLFASFASLIGPNIYGWAIDLSGVNYNTMMLIEALFMATAFGLMLSVRRGEAVAQEPAIIAGESLSSPGNI